MGLRTRATPHGRFEVVAMFGDAGVLMVMTMLVSVAGLEGCGDESSAL
jgi:hypothetical protein